MTFDTHGAGWHLAGVPVRLRLPELLDEHQLTAHAVARRSEGRINASTLYRLTRSRGAVRYLDAELLDALCDVLGVPLAAVVERATPRRGRGR